MKLQGQHGYAMVALLVAMAIMAVMMTAVMPSWSQMARREKEAELVFRGEQYARAIGLFQRRAGPGVLPPSIDVLVDQKFLRKKYKDPITNDDFVLVGALTPAAGAGTGPGRGAATPGGRSSAAPTQGSVQQVQTFSQSGGRGSAPPGGIMGVASKSTDESLREYKGRTHYNEWQFVYVAATQTPGAPADPGNPGGPGQRGNGPGGRGVPSGSGAPQRGAGPGGRGGAGAGGFPGGGLGGSTDSGRPPQTPFGGGRGR